MGGGLYAHCDLSGNEELLSTAASLIPQGALFFLHPRLSSFLSVYKDQDPPLLAAPVGLCAATYIRFKSGTLLIVA